MSLDAAEQVNEPTVVRPRKVFRMPKPAVRREALLILLFSTTITAHYLYVSEFPTGSIHWLPWLALLGAALVGLLFLARLRTAALPRKSSLPAVLWVLFALCAVASCLLHSAGIAPGMFYLIGVPVIFFNMLPLLFGRRGSFILACSVLLSALTLIVMSLVLAPPRFGEPYQGILAYTIHLGEVSSLMVAATLGLLGGALSYGKAGRRYVIWLSVMLFIALMVGMTTAYRTSVATSLLLIIVFTVLNYKRAAHLMRVYAAFVAIMIALGLAASLSSYGEAFRVWEALATKQERRAEDEAGGITSYRDEQAKTTIAHARWFGYGTAANPRDYLQTTIGYHSAFTAVLGRYGIPAIFCFLGVWLSGIKGARRYMRATAETDPYNNFPLLCILFFVFFTLGSVVLYPWLTGPMFPVLTSIGIVVMREAVDARKRASGTVSVPAA